MLQRSTICVAEKTIQYSRHDEVCYDNRTPTEFRYRMLIWIYTDIAPMEQILRYVINYLW